MTSKRAASSPPPAQQIPHKRSRANRETSQQSSDYELTPPRGRTRNWEEPPGLIPSRLQASKPSLEPSVPVVEDTFRDETSEDDLDQLLERIRTAVEYTRSRLSRGLPLMQTTRFKLPLQTTTYTPSDTNATALALLSSGPAALMLKSPTFVVYEIGTPVPYLVAEGAGVRLLHSAQWWVGKTSVEVRSGLWADETDFRRAESKLMELETKRQKKVGKTLKQKEIDWKLEEGLRRQEAGLYMFEDGEDDGEQDEESEESEEDVEDEEDEKNEFREE